jgi:phosphoribosylformimino-5-aminoimidazole carboxamide ribotide isomerase
MTLAQVGSQQGPDFAKLRQFCKDYPNKNFIAAGGVRHVEDLIHLQQLGIKQALIASSLHSGAISQRDIETLKNR